MLYLPNVDFGMVLMMLVGLEEFSFFRELYMVIVCLQTLCAAWFQLRNFVYPLFALQWKLDALNGSRTSLMRLVIGKTLMFDFTDSIGVSRMKRTLFLLSEANDESELHSEQDFADTGYCDWRQIFHTRSKSPKVF